MLPPPVPQIASLGRVVSVRGSQARIGVMASPEVTATTLRATVGQFFGIRGAKATIVAIITEMSRENIDMRDNHVAIASVDLLGEISREGRFQRGVTSYPTIGDAVDILTADELRVIYTPTGRDQVNIGTLQQDQAITAYVNIEEMLSKHFAVLGSTGVGKSTSVSLLLNEILVARPSLRVFLLDVHNEYGRCFGPRALVLNPRNLKLPFWLFNFEEFVDVLFGGRPGVPEEMEVLSEVIPIAKATYLQYANSERIGLKRIETRATGFTPDTPVPYRLVDLISLIDERMGKLENRSSRIIYHKLIQRIEVVRNDARYSFMFENANVGGDSMAEVVSHLFRLPANGKPMTVMQLAGFPADVVDSVVSVLCRMAFDFGLWSDGVSPLLFICEEAHRYASSSEFKTGFGPTRRALSRIAKEGRKYGVYLGLVTQRPYEIDPNIISQCNTLFVMRLANDRDQALIRSAVSDAASSLLTFVPSLGTGEAFVFGSGVALPMQMRFSHLPDEFRPSSDVGENAKNSAEAGLDLISSVIDRWRNATMSQKAYDGESYDTGFAREASPSIQPQGGTFDPERSRLLKQPLSAALGSPDTPKTWR